MVNGGCVISDGDDGRLRVAFRVAGTRDDFDQVLDDLKESIYYGDREYDPDEKCWRVDTLAYDDLKGWALRWFAPQHVRVTATLHRQYQAPPPPPPPPPRPDPHDPYTVLGLLPGAPLALVKAAYRALATLHHPDVGGDTERMKQINAAYERLRESA